MNLSRHTFPWQTLLHFVVPGLIAQVFAVLAMVWMKGEITPIATNAFAADSICTSDANSVEKIDENQKFVR